MALERQCRRILSIGQMQGVSSRLANFTRRLAYKIILCRSRQRPMVMPLCRASMPTPILLSLLPHRAGTTISTHADTKEDHACGLQILIHLHPLPTVSLLSPLLPPRPCTPLLPSRPSRARDNRHLHLQSAFPPLGPDLTLPLAPHSLPLPAKALAAPPPSAFARPLATSDPPLPRALLLTCPLFLPPLNPAAVM